MKGPLIFLTMLFFSALYTYYVGAQTSMLLVYMFVLCIPVSLLLTLPLRKYIDVTLEIPSAEVEKGGVIKIILHLKNKSFLPIPFLRIGFMDTVQLIQRDFPEDSLSLSPHETKSITVRYFARHRGVVHLGLRRLFLKDYLGLFSFSLLKNLEVHQYTGRFTVLPNISDMKPNSKILHGSDGRANRMNETESMASGISFHTGEPGHEFREYQAGDPLHKVHWKLSAKTDRLMVRKSEGSGASKLCFILDPFLLSGSNEKVKRKRTLIPEDMDNKLRITEDKLLETLLSVVNMVIRLGRNADIWLYDQGQWQVKSISQKKDLIELQRNLAQYRFLDAIESNGGNRLPLFSMAQQQKMNRNFKGSEAILFTAGYDHQLQKLLQSNDLKGMTLRIIQIKDMHPDEIFGEENIAPLAEELLCVLDIGENLSGAII